MINSVNQGPNTAMDTRSKEHKKLMNPIRVSFELPYFNFKRTVVVYEVLKPPEEQVLLHFVEEYL